MADHLDTKERPATSPLASIYRMLREAGRAAMALEAEEAAAAAARSAEQEGARAQDSR